MRKTLLPVLLISFVFVLSGCDYIIPSAWNYRITVNIETPEGIKSGSAVRQVINYENYARFINPDVSSRSTSVKGEAVVIDLGERGVVFALINWDSYRELYNAFPTEGPATAKGAAFYDSLKIGTKADLKDVKARPKLVVFKDIKNPKSIKPVYYGKIENVLGKGVYFKSITVEITDKPVTWGIVDDWAPKGYEKINIGYYKFKRGKS